MDEEEKERWVKAVQEAKSLSDIEIVFRKLWPGLFPKPFRKPLLDFPDVIIHTAETSVKKHPLYAAAKTGDAEAASILVNDTFKPDTIETL